jgi:hypothetical protein
MIWNWQSCNHCWAAPRNYIIFVARKRQLKKVFGIRNSHLIQLFRFHDPNKQSTSLLAYIRNAFSMLGRNGKPAEEPDLDAYRGGFTPHFYPNRFKMKDCIYEQRLEVLSILINQVVARYDRAGVQYVEFSLGINDLMNQDVFKHLVGGSGCGPFSGQIPLIPKSSKPMEKRQKTGKSDDSSGGNKSKSDIPLEATLKAMTGVDCNDLSGENNNRSDILKKKNPKTTWKAMTGMYYERPKKFRYGFLAGFGRELFVTAEDRIPIASLESLENLYQMTNADINATTNDDWLERKYPKIFGPFSPLEKLEKELNSKKEKFMIFGVNMWLAWTGLGMN